MNYLYHNQIFGLNIIRALAVLMVMYDHVKRLVFPNYSLVPLLKLPFGSDLFLVLSGYLIGKSIIHQYDTYHQYSFKYTLMFFIKRWLRTIPNYYLFLLINIIMISFHLIPGFINKYLITYFVFAQNLYKPYDFLFWESWCLAIQEWFYLIFPLLTFGLVSFNKFKIKTIFLIIILMFLILPLVYRFIIPLSFDWDLYIRKITLARLDSIGFGLLGAFTHHYFKEFWNKYANFLFPLGLVFILIIINLNNSNWLFKNVFYFTLLSFSILLLLPKLSLIKEEKIPYKPITYISKISFSIYLIHNPVQNLIHLFIHPNSTLESLVFILLYIGITFLISSINYTYFEKYFMNYRDKLIKKIDN